MKKINLSHRFTSLFIVLHMLIVLTVAIPPATAEYAAAGGGKTVSYTCPAICADIGDSVDLSTFNVQFEYGKSTAADKISWTSADIDIKNGTLTPTAGIYLLTATCADHTKTVVLTVRAPGETDYLLYSNDFSSNADDGMRVIQETSGGKVIFSDDGVLTLDASASKDAYARVLLPEYLDGFGDIKIEATMKIESAVNAKRWGSIMLRLDTANNYPYMQTAIRSNAAQDNGTEIAERTSANKWNVTQKNSSSIKTSEYNTYTVDASENTIKFSINSKEQLTDNSVMHTLGACGFQANGCKLTVDQVKITVGDTPNAEETGDGNIGGIADVRDPQSNVVLPPSVIYEITNATDIEKITENSPSVAIINIDASLDVLLDGGKTTSLDEAISALNGCIIPAFRPINTTAAEALGEYLKASDYRDAFIISDDTDIIAAGRRAWYHLRGVLDLSERTANDSQLNALRGETNSAGCRVMLLPAALATRDNVSQLQSQFMTVWVNAAENDDLTLVRAITTGANGVITGDRAALENCFTKYFSKNTLIRSPEIIGHRGVPSLAHENTIAGSLRAYELGATMIENDIHLTRDGVIVVMHNSTIDATTNGTGAISSMTYEELSKYQVISNKNVAEGEPIPTLEDYFKTFGDKDVKLVVELKSTDLKLIPALVKLIRQYNYEDKMVVISFSEAQIKLFKEQMPEISVGYLNSTAYSSTNLTASLYGILDAVQMNGTTFNPSYNKGVFDADLIRALSYRGVTVWPWTINSQEDLGSYFAAGTYGITTNYSQYITNTYRNIYTDSTEYDLDLGEEPLITALTYGRKTVDISQLVTMKVISSTGTLEVSIDPVSGKLTYTGYGSANVIFGYSGNSNGKSYAKVTEVVTLNAAQPAETTSGNATTDATDVAPLSDGCGSTLSLSCAVTLTMAIIGMGLSATRRHK